MVYTCTLSKELQEQALKELNEDPKRRDEDIEHIRKWIKKQPHLNIRTDDAFILKMLRGCKFSLERTKEKIDMHYSLKVAVPEWFKGRDPGKPTLEEIFKKGILLPLKEKDDEGRQIFVFRQGAYSADEFSLDDVNMAMFMLLDLFQELDEPHQVTGVVMVLDMKGLSAGHMLQYPPTVMKKSMVVWQDGYATRNKSVHYVNTNALFETLFNTFKMFMKEKLRKRLHVYGSKYEKIYDDIPQRIMPKEYGGEGETIQEITDYWVNLMKSKRNWFIEDQKNTVDESKRPGKPKSSQDLFGLEGSFRKLNVD